MTVKTTANNVEFDPTALIQQELDLLQQFYQITLEFFTNYSFQLVGAFIIFIIGYFFANKIGLIVLRICENHKLDVTLTRFLANTSKMLVVAMVVVIALGKLGISITPFVAAIGAISLGAGLAFQGLLANYAAGFNIILIRPFVVGDTISVQGVTGIVREVLLAYTILVDEDGVEITIPNKHIVGEVLHNSKHESLVKLEVGISYQDDPHQAIALIESCLLKLDILADSSRLQLGIDNFGDSAIVIGVRMWTLTEKLHQHKFKANLAIYDCLKQHGIQIPFPQQDVHLYTVTK